MSDPMSQFSNITPVNSEPIQAFQWALENLSPGEVVRSSQLRDSFQKFLQRGTISQLRQLQLTARDLPVSSATLTSDEEVTPQVCCERTGLRKSVRNRESRTSKGKRTSSDHLCRPNNASKKCRTIVSTRTTTPIPFQSDVASFSPTPSVSDSDSIFSCPERPGASSICVPPDSCFPSPSHVAPDEDISSIEPLRTPHSDMIANAEQFFEARLGARTQRLRYLVRAVQGFLEAPNLEPGFAKAMWCSRSAIFTKSQTSDSNARLRNLYDGHRRIKQAREQYLYAARFCYIYLEHDLEELSKSHALKLSQGRGRMTAAFEMQAKIISTSVDVVKAERKAGRGYLQLLMEGGPGFILRLGCNVSTIWERKLSVSDISLIIEFLKTQMPDLYEDIKSYDELATQALLEGLAAYGWTKDEIISSSSHLFDELKQYANIEDIFSGPSQTGEVISPALPGLPDLMSADGYDTSPQCSLDDNWTPETVEYEISRSDVSFTDTYLTASQQGLSCMQDTHASCPELPTEIAEMSDAELESWMSLDSLAVVQTDEMMDVQIDTGAMVWDGAYDMHNSTFLDPSFMLDSFGTHV